MDSTRMSHFRERLQQEQSRLKKDLEGIEQTRVQKLRPPGELSDDPTHSADRGAEGLGKELTIEETLREEMNAVNDALERTREGIYGQCQRCGKEIDAQRLEAIPQASFCVECERAEEAT